MVPFSAFVVIPFGELLLPAYLKVFPNAIPNAFVTKAQLKEKKALLKSRQKTSAKKLHKKVNKYLIELGIDIRKIDQEQKIQEFIAKSGFMEEKLNIANADSNTLLTVGDFFGLIIWNGPAKRNSKTLKYINGL